MSVGRGFDVVAVACLAAAAGACSGGAAVSSIDAASSGADAAAGLGFARDIFPLLQAANCAECHNPEQRVVRHWAVSTPADTYTEWVNHPGFNHCDPNGGGIVAPPPDQIRVVPGDPDNSMVIHKLTDPWEMCGEFYGHMPPSPRPRLPAAQVDLIRAWIAAGAAP